MMAPLHHIVTILMCKSFPETSEEGTNPRQYLSLRPLKAHNSSPAIAHPMPRAHPPAVASRVENAPPLLLRKKETADAALVTHSQTTTLQEQLQVKLKLFLKEVAHRSALLGRRQLLDRRRQIQARHLQ